jgi:aldose 1-epimerase
MSSASGNEMTDTASHTDIVELQVGDMRLAVRPDLGGCIAGLWHRDAPVLRSTEPSLLQGPRQSACFPLVPYSNRLGHRRFEWQGRKYTTLPNFDDSPHSLHGVAWQSPWHVVSRQKSGLTLGYRHAPDGHWPFAFEVRQSFTLAPLSLRLDLELLNTDAADQPAGLGWHPYFPKRVLSHLHIDVDTRWESDSEQLPTHAVGVDGIDDEVARLSLDHCFAGWTEPAHVRDERFAIRIGATLTYLVVFTPQAREHFCVEPVSHINDAIHRPDPAAHGLKALRAGETLAASMTLEIEPL